MTQGRIQSRGRGLRQAGLEEEKNVVGGEKPCNVRLGTICLDEEDNDYEEEYEDDYNEDYGEEYKEVSEEDYKDDYGDNFEEGYDEEYKEDSEDEHKRS